VISLAAGRAVPPKLSSETMTAGDVYSALWRQRYLIVVLTAVFVGAMWYVTSRQTRPYEASTLVRVRERPADAGNASTALLAATTLAQTYSKILGSGALRGEIETLVAKCVPSSPNSGSRGALPAAPGRQHGAASSTKVADRASSCAWLGDTSARRIAPRKISEVKVSGSPVQDLDLLSITTRSVNPTNAMIAANAVPLALRSFIRKSGSVSEQIITVKAATLPSSPVSRQWPLKIGIAVLLGLVLNGALALLIELVRDRFPEPDELERALGHPILATVPTLRLHPVPGVGVQREKSGSVLAVEHSMDRGGSSRPSPRVGPES
jgi:capsular polysaccharide biosynthesis protein